MIKKDNALHKPVCGVSMGYILNTVMKGIGEMKRTNIYLTEIQQKRFRVIARQKGISSSELIRRVLDEWLEKYQAKKARG